MIGKLYTCIVEYYNTIIQKNTDWHGKAVLF